MKIKNELLPFVAEAFERLYKDENTLYAANDHANVSFQPIDKSQPKKGGSWVRKGQDCAMSFSVAGVIADAEVSWYGGAARAKLLEVRDVVAL